MNVEVICFGAMREYLPEGGDGRSTVLDLPDGSSVADVVGALGAPDRLVHAVLVNSEPSGLDRSLKESDQITLMPHYSGG